MMFVLNLLIFSIDSRFDSFPPIMMTDFKKKLFMKIKLTLSVKYYKNVTFEISDESYFLQLIQIILTLAQRDDQLLSRWKSVNTSKIKLSFRWINLVKLYLFSKFSDESDIWNSGLYEFHMHNDLSIYSEFYRNSRFRRINWQQLEFLSWKFPLIRIIRSLYFMHAVRNQIELNT